MGFRGLSVYSTGYRLHFMQRPLINDSMRFVTRCGYLVDNLANRKKMSSA